MATLIQRFRRDIVIIGWFALATFLALALVSFDPSDPSFNSTGVSAAAKNFCGYIGSFLSDILFQAFGLTAWFFAIAAYFAAYRTFQGRAVKSKSQRLILGAILLVVLCSLLALYFPDTKIFARQIYVGGFVGLAVSKQMALAFNKMGAGVIFWSLLLILVVFFTEKPIDELWPQERAAKLLAAVKAWFKSLFAARPVTAKRERAKSQPALIETKAEPTFIEQAEEEEFDAESAAPATGTQEEKPSKFRFSLIKKEDIEPKPKKAPPKIQRHIENWELPKLSLLNDAPATRVKIDEKELRNTTFMLEDKLAQFDVNGKVVAVKPGPAVTMFEFKPNADVKISKITELADDLALALSSESIRIIAPVPGRDVVGIETSNPSREKVFLKDNLTDPAFWDEKCRLPQTVGERS